MQMMSNNLREHQSKPSHIQKGSVNGYSENYEYKVIDMLKERQGGLKYINYISLNMSEV